jgi:hypothetical protein
MSCDQSYTLVLVLRHAWRRDPKVSDASLGQALIRAMLAKRTVYRRVRMMRALTSVSLPHMNQPADNAKSLAATNWSDPDEHYGIFYGLF